MSTLSIVFAFILSIAWTPIQQDLPPAPIPQKTAESNPDANGIYHFSKDLKDFTPPKLLYSVEPEFSEIARKRKVSGNIKVKLMVDTGGSVRNVTILKSAVEQYTSKKDREAAFTLDPKAIEAVSKYRFEPALFQGKPVPCWMTVEVNFQIF